MRVRLPFALLLLWPLAAAGQVTIGPTGPQAPAGPNAPLPDEPQRIKLNVTPAAEPVPPMRYRFDVPPGDRRPGNAVPFYYRAVVLLAQTSQESKGKLNEAFEKWLDMPLADLPREEVRVLLDGYGHVFGELKRATVRESVEWDWHLEELSGVEAVSMLLPEVQETRQLARLLSLRARLAIVEGRFDDAEHDLRAGYALAAAVAEPQVLINGLVGIAIASVMDGVVTDWIAAPGSPNLYWALAALPSPRIELRPALEYELAFSRRFALWLDDAETADVPPAVWRERMNDLLRQLLPVADDNAQDAAWAARLMVPGLAVRNYASAKRELIGRGYDAARVEAMPVGQVLAIQQKFVDDVIAGEFLKSFLVPSVQADAVAKRAESDLARRGYLGGPPYLQSMEPLPVMALLMPAVRQVGKASRRAEASLAGLKALEAIRLHAAAIGTLPKSLDEITAAPVPLDPLTGKSFPYSLEGDTAVLTVAGQPDQPSVTRRYEIMLKR